MSAKLRWDRGGDALLVRLEDEKIALSSTEPFAPGSRPEATFEATGERVWIKVFASRRQPDGLFHVEGRLINLTRELRESLKKAIEEATV